MNGNGSQSEQSQSDIGRRRLSQVFEYLNALNQLRNPAKKTIFEQPWFRWLRELPNYPTITQGGWKDTPVQMAAEGEISEAEGDDFFLQVDRPTLTKAPPPPEDIIPWLLRGWENPDGQAEVQPTRTVLNLAGIAAQEQFDEDAERVTRFAEWKRRWEVWAEDERPARHANKVFEDLYELRGQLERESERIELVLGDGILDWRHPSGRVYHPILVQRLALEFDASIPRFTVREADQPPELYTQLLYSLEDVDGFAIQRLRQALDEDSFIAPLNGAATTSFLRGLIVQISERGQGQYLDTPDSTTVSDVPRLWRDLVLYTRARNQGFSLALEAIREDLRDSSELSGPLLRIVGINSLSETDNSTDASTTPSFAGSRGNEDLDVLLTKPANGEQVQIARRLDKYGCVLVQGPPGTGKTHTIGNLIGHLLAQGKSILVTSHSTKALRVLREQVVEELRPLCVSVLEAGGENQAQLEGAIGDIVDRLQGADADTLDQQAAALAEERKQILARLERARIRLRDARFDEYRDVVVAGQSWTPSDAARIVADGKEAASWIPSPITADQPLPLSVAEVAELYQTNVAVEPGNEGEINQPLPDSTRLLAPDEFRAVTETMRQIQQRGSVGRADLWESAGSRATLEVLAEVLEKLTRSVQEVQDSSGWQLAAIAAGRAGGTLRTPWDDLLQVISETRTVCVNEQTILLRHGPSLPPEGSPSDHLRIAGEIASHLERGGKLGGLHLLTHRAWKNFLDGAKVGGQPPRERVHFESLVALARVSITRTELIRRWERQMVPLGGPAISELGNEPEEVCNQYTEQIARALGWWNDVLTPLTAALQSAGFRWDAFLADAPPNHARNGALLRVFTTILNDLPPIITAKVDQLRVEAARAQLAGLSDYLARTGGERASDIVQRLQRAVGNQSLDAYRKAFAHLLELERQRGSMARRRELLGRLAPVAPAWAGQIQLRQPPHDGGNPPGDALAAWQWRQLNDELERRAATSLGVILREIGDLTSALQRTTVNLVDRRTWAAQRRRTGLDQQMALMGWRQLMRRIGRGTGKRAPLLRAEARRLMKTAQSAVPVWIMPLARVVETYDPRTTHFDVVIIDEASQSDVMALCALYLGKSVVVVGDHEQVSPLAIGQQADQVQRLIDAHLIDIPNKQLYDGKLSVYDLAQTAFGGLICLHEHFRCVPEIIEFSNHLAYQGKIVPLRDSSGVRLKPHTIAHRVEGSLDTRNVNRREAQEIVALLAAAIEQPEYASSTFGVISLLGDEQAREIDTLLRQYLSPVEYERRRIICGNAAQFQGDERDVMFLSIVDAPKDGPLSLRTEGPEGLFKKRFNVAASRARDQMWVVYSLNPAIDLQAGDIRRQLIEHAQDPGARLRELDRLQAKTESPFERQVLERLVMAGYRVIPQYAVGAYRLDFVVEGKEGRLAVECDGDRFHTLDNLAEDMERQALLERLGWTFARIRGSEFFRDPDLAMRPVFARLQELGISPEAVDAQGPGVEAASSELRDRIVRRAAELCREWNGKVVEEVEQAPATDVDNELIEADPPTDVPHREEVIPVEDVRSIQAFLPFEGEDSSLSRDTPLPYDPILRAIARNLSRDWRTCPVCRGRANLQNGPFGPYSDCFHPAADEPGKGRHAVSTQVINAALHELGATCPECWGQLVVPDGNLHQTVRCSQRDCRFTIRWEDFSKQRALIQVRG